MITDKVTLYVEAWELFREPTLAGVIAGSLLGLMGVYIVLRRMVFLSAALSQTAGLGVAAAFYAQIHWGLSATVASPALGATVATMVCALVLADRRMRDSDSMLGLVFLVGSAMTLALGTRIVQELHDIQTLLFGSAVAVVPEDFRQLVLWAVPLTLLHLWWWRGFAAVTHDPDDARVRGLPAGLLEIVLVLSLAAGISIVTRVLGALPAFAFSVLPAIAALRISPNVPWALLLGGVFGALSGGLGYVAAFVFELPVGASQALVAAAFVVVVWAVEAVRR